MAPDEDQSLWQRVCHNVTPLKNKGKYVGGAHHDVGMPVKKTVKEKVAPHHHYPMPELSMSGMKEPPRQTEEVLLAVNQSNKVDRNTAKHVIAGKYRPEATLDLHGMNQEQAFNTLLSFIDAAYTKKKRCVLVITGKGGVGHKRGTLYTQTPKWLNHPTIRHMVLMFSHARANEGGEGALYVLLKRHR